jgi:hypothetical protein
MDGHGQIQIKHKLLVLVGVYKNDISKLCTL